jgi:hypothetical protein
VTSSTPTTPDVPVEVSIGPTHGCARCGALVGAGVGLCEECNPLGLRDSASSQVHGTVFLAVVVGVILLAVLARLATAGLGPFPATIDAVVPAGDGLAVTLTVTNEGDGSGQTTCRIATVADRSTVQGTFVLTPQLRAGETRTFTTAVSDFGSAPVDLTVSCRTP